VSFRGMLPGGGKPGRRPGLMERGHVGVGLLGKSVYLELIAEVDGRG
jgi:hypothetical protein